MKVRRLFESEVGLGRIRWYSPPYEKIDWPWLQLHDLIVAAGWDEDAGMKVLTQPGYGAYRHSDFGWMISYWQANDLTRHAKGYAEGAQDFRNEFTKASQKAGSFLARKLKISVDDLREAEIKRRAA